jgi:hypothetical protein
MPQRWKLTLATLVLAALPAWAADPAPPPAVPPALLPDGPFIVPPARVGPDQRTDGPPVADPCVPGGRAAPPFTPGFLGDFGASNMLVTATYDGVNTTTVNRHFTNAARGAYKASEFDSPVPTDRVYVGFDYLNNISAPGQRGFNEYTETLGWEWAFLDNHGASVGLRLPINQTVDSSRSIAGDPATGTYGTFNGGTGVGDLTAVFKFAVWHDGRTGDIFTVGFSVCLPTGTQTHNIDYVAGETPLETRMLHDTLLQPFGAWLFNFDRFFVQGFTAVVLALTEDDVTFLTNDFGVGYRLYQSADAQPISAVIPLLELHVNTPIAYHRSSSAVPPLNNVVDSTAGVLSGQFYSGSNQVIVTPGVCLGVWDRAFLSVGASVPLTGPKPYDYVVVSELNLLY